MKGTFYRNLYRYIVFPLLRSFAGLAAGFNRKIDHLLKARKPRNGVLPWLKFPSNTRPIWIHCASGEFEYAKPVIEEIKAKWPDQKVLVTYLSLSFSQAIHKHSKVDMACPLPWDQSDSLFGFICHHHPRCLLIARTDTWPEMIYQCQKNNIPTLLFSATFVKSSGRLKPWAKGFSGWLLAKLTNIYCVSQDDVQVLNTHFTGINAEAKGDTRFDQVVARLQSPRPTNEEIRPQDLQVFVAGSTWPQDENVVLPAIANCQKSSLPWRYIIAPHEPNPKHLQWLAGQLEKHQLKYRMYSVANQWSVDEVLVVDQVGILAELYTWGRIAFVGGSFRKTVHSVMEPLAAGCLCLVGPNHYNNREALAFKRLKLSGSMSYSMVNEIHNSEEIQKVLVETASQLREDITQWQTQIGNEITNRSGATRSVIGWISENANLKM